MKYWLVFYFDSVIFVLLPLWFLLGKYDRRIIQQCKSKNCHLRERERERERERDKYTYFKRTLFSSVASIMISKCLFDVLMWCLWWCQDCGKIILSNFIFKHATLCVFSAEKWIIGNIMYVLASHCLDALNNCINLIFFYHSISYMIHSNKSVLFLLNTL